MPFRLLPETQGVSQLTCQSLLSVLSIGRLDGLPGTVAKTASARTVFEYACTAGSASPCSSEPTYSHLFGPFKNCSCERWGKLRKQFLHPQYDLKGTVVQMITVLYSKSPSTASHQTPPLSHPDMISIDGQKWACDTCIKGHRVNGCNHQGMVWSLSHLQSLPQQQANR